MAVDVKDPFPEMKPTDLPLFKVAMLSPEKSEPHELVIEGFGPETIIGAVKDLVRTGRFQDKIVQRIVIELPQEVV
jgi:hypothetical protein